MHDDHRPTARAPADSLTETDVPGMLTVSLHRLNKAS